MDKVVFIVCEIELLSSIGLGNRECRANYFSFRPFHLVCRRKATGPLSVNANAPAADGRVGDAIRCNAPNFLSSLSIHRRPV